MSSEKKLRAAAIKFRKENPETYNTYVRYCKKIVEKMRKNEQYDK